MWAEGWDPNNITTTIITDQPCIPCAEPWPSWPHVMTHSVVAGRSSRDSKAGLAGLGWAGLGFPTPGAENTTQENTGHEVPKTTGSSVAAGGQQTPIHSSWVPVDTSRCGSGCCGIATGTMSVSSSGRTSITGLNCLLPAHLLHPQPSRLQKPPPRPCRYARCGVVADRLAALAGGCRVEDATTRLDVPHSHASPGRSTATTGPRPASRVHSGLASTRAPGPS